MTVRELQDRMCVDELFEHRDWYDLVSEERRKAQQKAKVNSPGGSRRRGAGRARRGRRR